MFPTLRQKRAKGWATRRFHTNYPVVVVESKNALAIIWSALFFASYGTLKGANMLGFGMEGNGELGNGVKEPVGASMLKPYTLPPA